MTFEWRSECFYRRKNLFSDGNFFGKFYLVKMEVTILATKTLAHE